MAHRTHPREMILHAGLIVCIIGCLHASMDITAYEYYRKFNRDLALGECPYRQTAQGDHTYAPERCLLEQKGVVNSIRQETSDTRNELIKSPNAVVLYLGLCNGEAASYLGILLDGECVAVDIASHLTFGTRTVVRAFVGYYRSSMDTLDTRNQAVREGMESYYKDKYYVKNLSYGTLEIIFVQFRFYNATQAEKASKVTLSDPTMSVYMEEIHKQAGEPKGVMIISLSTAKKKSYKVHKENEWNRALRYVHILEMQIKNRRNQIKQNKSAPLLKYELFPFLDDGLKGSLRLKDPISYKKMSMLEIQIRQTLNILKKANKRCRRGSIKRTAVCRRIRKLRREAIGRQNEIHMKRSAWVTFTNNVKRSMTSQYTSKIKLLETKAKKQFKRVKVYLRKLKRQQLKLKKQHKKKPNEVPPKNKIRHFKQKKGRRNLRNSTLRRSHFLRLGMD